MSDHSLLRDTDKKSSRIQFFVISLERNFDQMRFEEEDLKYVTGPFENRTAAEQWVLDDAWKSFETADSSLRRSGIENDRWQPPHLIVQLDSVVTAKPWTPDLVHSATGVTA